MLVACFCERMGQSLTTRSVPLFTTMCSLFLVPLSLVSFLCSENNKEKVELQRSTLLVPPILNSYAI